jgi:alkanesulfonate monooxygenase SsuD/methylene tetrahydromethanopterin reductase-like flavin-dependent oxidoreductase (luciferase family)
MRRLAREERVTFEGEFFRTEKATIYDRPEVPVPIYVAASGAVAARLAGRVGDGFICTSGKARELYTERLCGMALFRVIDPLLRPAAAAARAEANKQSVRLRELEREKNLVLKAIREIEHDYQMRKISESDYQKMSHRYRARAMRLIQEVEAGDNFRSLIEAELKHRLAAIEAADVESEGEKRA